MPRPRRSWKPRGPAPQIDKREQYLALVAQGVSNSAACRIVGINRRTGTRWRYGRTVLNRAGVPRTYDPITTTAPAARPLSDRFLSETERLHIADLLVLGHSRRHIATTLGRSPSTISRENRRNADPDTGLYHPFQAHRHALARRARPKPRRLADPQLRRLVQDHLDRHWSPEQIVETLAATFPDRADLHLVHETIYRELYRELYRRDASLLHRDATTVLRTRRPRRRARRRIDQRHPGSPPRWS